MSVIDAARSIFRRPNPEVLQIKENTLARCRAAHARALKLALLQRSEGWPEFVDVLNENIKSIENALQDFEKRKFPTQEEIQKQALTL